VTKPLTKEQKDAHAVAVPQVLVAIHAVSKALSQEGIAKARKNEQQGFRFRGIDEVMNALAPLLVEHGLVIMPRILERTETVRTTKSGGNMYSVTVAAEFVFLAVADGSTVTARTYGEAMDSGDKGTNKAQAHAYKYAAFQTFCIPTEGSGDTDSDANTPEETVAAPRKPAPAKPGLSERAIAARDKAAAAAPPVNDEIPHLEPKQEPPAQDGASAPDTGHPQVTKEDLLQGDKKYNHQGVKVIVACMKSTTDLLKRGKPLPKGMEPAALDAAYDKWERWWKESMPHMTERDIDHIVRWLDLYYKPAAHAMDRAAEAASDADPAEAV
jgi:hypothetical protein